MAGADFGSPIAQNVNINPNQGLQTLSGLLGIKQQQNSLVQQQQAIQGQAAQVQQEQQTAQQRAAAGNFFKNFDLSKHVSDDGTLDLNSALTSPDLRASGDSMPAIAQQLLGIKNAQLSGKQSLANLNENLRQQLRSTVGGLAQDPDVLQGNETGKGKVQDAIKQFSSSGGDDAARIASIYGPAISNTPADKIPQVLRNFQLTAKSAGEQLPQTAIIDNGPTIQGASVAPGTGAINRAGPVVRKDIAPAVVTTPSGPLAKVSGNTLTKLNSGGPASGDATSPTDTRKVDSSATDLNPTATAQTVNLTRAKGVADRVQQAQAAANNTSQAQDALERSLAIIDKPDSPNTAGLYEWKRGIKNFLAGVGYDTGTADDSNTLVKNLARYEAARATQAGLGGTDAARELAHNGSPNTALDKTALKGVLTQSLATEKALSSYANIQSKTKDPDQLAKNESDFRNIPHLVQGYEYGLSKNPEDAEAFLQKHGLSHKDMAGTRQAIKEFESR